MANHMHSIMSHPESISGRGFTHKNGTMGVKLQIGDIDLTIFNSEEAYRTPEETVTADEIVKALRQAANELARHIRKEAQSAGQ